MEIGLKIFTVALSSLSFLLSVFVMIARYRENKKNKKSFKDGNTNGNDEGHGCNKHSK